MSLDFETCKRLKEVGFPQPDLECDYLESKYAYRADDQELQMFHHDNDEGGTVGNNYSNRLKDLLEEGIELIFCPQIEDLLREIKREKDFVILHYVGDKCDARAFNEGEVLAIDGLIQPPGRFYIGDTPEQALANLYISLHTKSNAQTI